MKYLKELDPILHLPEDFLVEFNSFLINSSLIPKERERLVKLILMLNK